MPCLAALRAAGFRVGISGNQPEAAETSLAALGVAADFIASSARWGVEKPDPDFFARAVEAAGVPAGAVAYVGDRLDNDVSARSKAARRARVMTLQKGIVRRRNRGRIGERVRVLVDGPATDDRLVLKGRLSTQAPEIDASVYLTDCDPSTFQAGGFAEMEVVGAHNYDLIARPVHPQPSTPGPQLRPQPPASSL